MTRSPITAGGEVNLELARPEQRLAGIDADRAILAEIGAGLAVLEVEGDQPQIGGRGQDPLGARPGRAGGAAPDRDAAAGEHDWPGGNRS